MKQRKSFFRQFLDHQGHWALFAVLIMVWMIVWAFSDSLSARRLTKDGAEAQATVMSLREKTTHIGRGTQHFYYVRVNFVAGDTAVLAEKSVPESFYRSMRTGMVIPILYWTGDPTLIEVQPGSFAKDAKKHLVFALIATAATLLVGGFAFHRTRYARWMIRNGVRRRAKVEAHVECPIPVQSKKWQLVWRDPSGTRAESRFHYFPDLPAVGSTVVILTDPSGRRASIWLRDL